jgi:hypothetical protein
MVAISTESRVPSTKYQVATLLLVAFFYGPVLSAQSCPKGNVYEAAPVEEVLHANSAEVIFRYAAISGELVAPSLQRLSKTGMKVDSIPGAAQVSLARLGDTNSLGELEKELNDPESSYETVPKLVRVGTDRAVSLLMSFLIAHISDDSLHHHFGDYGSDLRFKLIASLSEQLQIGPILPAGVFSVYFSDWLTWWDQNKGKPITLSISADLHDPYLQCLARKVEWGFPDAIFDMTGTRDPQVIPVLRLLARFGNPKRRPFVLTTLQGRAELGLAQLGDQEELQTIDKELDLPGCNSAIEELRQLGGRVAVATLINAFDSTNYLPQYKDTPGYQRVVNERNQAIENALVKMVVSPPETQVTPQTAKKWKVWWEKNRTAAQIVKPPVARYE